MHKADESGEIQGHPTRHNELLGGHGDDVIHAGGAGDVLWGDYKPSGQPETQIDQLIGGPGKDFIYAGHGRNVIVTGAGHDVVHAHFGRGEIHCGPGATVFLSHSSRRLYKLDGCRRISYRTLGY
jgi:Ca2+-binding RTX toxin-like protein